MVLAGGVLGVEVQLARTQPRLAGPGPPVLDAIVGAHRPGPPVRVVWLGDSTAAGVGAAHPEGSLPHQVASRLDRPIELAVLARSGARVGDVLEHQLPRVAGLRPDLVVVSVGANDVVHLTSGRRFRSRYGRLLDGLRPHPVLVLGVPDMGAVSRFAQPLRAVAGWRGRALDGAVRGAVARRGEVAYVDIAGRTGPAIRRQPDRYLARDGYHPSDAGYGLWAEAVVDVARGLPLFAP